MARYKDYNWDVGVFIAPTFDQVQCSVLMDIRDELKDLNSFLEKQGFLFIPDMLRQIEKNTRKPVKKKSNKNKPTRKHAAKGS